MSETQKKDGRGKKAGSKDCVNVPIELFVKYQETLKVVPVNRKWVELMATAFNIELLPPVEKEKVGFMERSVEQLEPAATEAPRIPAIELEEEEL